MRGINAGPRRDIQEQGNFVGRSARRDRGGFPRWNDRYTGCEQHGRQKRQHAAQIGDA